MITSFNVSNSKLHAQFMDFIKKRHLSFSVFVQICEVFYLTNKNGIFQKMFDFDAVVEMLEFPKLSSEDKI